MGEPQTWDEALAAWHQGAPVALERGPREITVHYQATPVGWHVTCTEVEGFSVKGPPGAPLAHAMAAARRSLRAWLDPAVTVREVVWDFIYRCGGVGTATADALVAEVRERIAGGSDERAARPIVDSQFVTAVVVSLNWDYGASLTGIPCDMWSAVCAGTHDESLTAYVECDLVEDGFAGVWHVFAEAARAAEILAA